MDSSLYFIPSMVGVAFIFAFAFLLPTIGRHFSVFKENNKRAVAFANDMMRAILIGITFLLIYIGYFKVRQYF